MNLNGARKERLSKDKVFNHELTQMDTNENKRNEDTGYRMQDARCRINHAS